MPTRTALPRLALLAVAALALPATAQQAVSADVLRPSTASLDAPRLSAVLDPGVATVGRALQDVVVTGTAGAEALARAVTGLGGTVGDRLDLVGGLEARVPADRVLELSRTPDVTAVTADRVGTLSTAVHDDATTASVFARSSQATAAWAQGALGQGVGVAVLDTGVSPMKDLEGRLVHGPDLSGEGTVVDSYGHGTVMAGVIGGSGADSAGRAGGAYTGVAPRSTLVSVKVAGRNGAVDVSTMLQAMHWVSAYRDQYGIRVLNLSWGVPSTQDPRVDPLSLAVQRLWQQGVVVVVAVGNSGPRAGTVLKPADDPLVLTVGAYNDGGTADPADDELPGWTSRGPTAQGLAKPDLVAPGRTLVAARSYGSTVETDNPKALVAPSYIKGSGTSQAAAVASGLVADLLSARPGLTPDQVKRLLTSTASPLPGLGSANDQGAGRVQLRPALTADAGPATWQTPTATGTGSLQASRGGTGLVTHCDGVETVVQGEMDARCRPFDAAAWRSSAWTGDAWTGVTWRAQDWTGVTWRDGAWEGGSWSGVTWRGDTWSGVTWRDDSWSGVTWRGVTWRGDTWSGVAYTTAAYGDEVFLNAFWADRPKWHQTVAGERSEPAPHGLSRDRCLLPSGRCL